MVRNMGEHVEEQEEKADGKAERLACQCFWHNELLHMCRSICVCQDYVVEVKVSVNSNALYFYSTVSIKSLLLKPFKDSVDHTIISDWSIRAHRSNDR